jgi:DNA-binding GntR family transcriptional regulator
MTAIKEAAIARNGGATLRRPSRLRLVDDVARSIEDAILALRMAPGERLVETRLCDELGVSRTTLREALLMLERRGLVRSIPRRGTFVTRLAREEAVDLCRSRALLEAYALSVGYDRLDDEALARLDLILDEMATLNLPDDVPRLIKLDLAFHRVLAEGADAPHLLELWASLDGKMSALILSSIEHHHASIDDIVALHRELLDAVRGGDVATARTAVLDHYIGDERGLTVRRGKPVGDISNIVGAVMQRAGRVRPAIGGE